VDSRENAVRASVGAAVAYWSGKPKNRVHAGAILLGILSEGRKHKNLIKRSGRLLIAQLGRSPKENFKLR